MIELHQVVKVYLDRRSPVVARDKVGRTSVHAAQRHRIWIGQGLVTKMMRTGLVLVQQADGGFSWKDVVDVRWWDWYQTLE